MTDALRIGENYEKAGDFPPEGEELLGPDEAKAKAERDRAERLQSFGARLAAQRDEWITARANTGWDKRVQEDIDQYHAQDSAGNPADMMATVEAGFPGVAADRPGATRSRIKIGLTRQKSNAAEARLSDILLPTDENNWSVAPTPKPELSKLAKDHTQAIDPATNQPMVLQALQPGGTMGPVPVKKSDIAMAVEKQAREKAQGMTRTLEDQFVECDYNGVQRKVIHDAAMMGTGVLKGPITTNKTRQAWSQIEGATYGLEVVQETKPASYRCDPRFIWEDPDCGDDIQNGKGIYELEQLTPKKVRELRKQPEYIESQLKQALEEGPQRSTALVMLSTQLSRTLYPKNTYDVWTYTGEIDAQDLADAGVEIDPEDVLESKSGCVVMINSTVVKAYLNPIETGELPYDFYPWEKVTDSPRGYGVPYLMRSPARVIDSAWRMMMDNASVCAGPQIIVKKSKLQPEDGTYTIYSRKVWLFTGEDGESVNDAFTFAEVNMHQAELKAIIDMGFALADAETSTPMITQGEHGSAPETVGGMQMLLNSSNVVLRRLVKQYDDYVTKRHVKRYYHYNMAHSEDPDIKGDFDVDARGSSALLVRDIQNQAFTNLLAAGSNPVFAKFLDPKKLFEKALAAQHVQPQDVMKTDEQIKADEEAAAANPAPQDPKVQAAQITAQSRVAEAEARAEGDLSEIELRRDIAKQNHAAQIAKLEMEERLMLLKYANDQNISLQDAKTQLAIAAMGYRQKSEQLQTESQLRITTGEGV